MSRIDDINALLKRADELYLKIESGYNNSLHSQKISSDLKIDIKDYVGHLRSVLDYLAGEIVIKHCPNANLNNKLYFPISSDRAKFDKIIKKSYPDLIINSKVLHDYLESIQPYNNGNDWLSNFNEINNKNKHNKLVEQVRTEIKRVNVKTQGIGSVSWIPESIRFGPGVYIGDIPVNSITQMPQQSPRQIVTVENWVDFKFEGLGISALQLLKEVLSQIKAVFKEVQSHL